MTQELIVEPKSQRAWIDHVKATLLERDRDIPVSDTIRDGESVRIVKTGGEDTVGLVLAKPQITVETCDVTAEGASDLLDLVSAIFFAARGEMLVGGQQVYEVRSLGGGAYNPDPEAKRPKYTRTFITGMRASAL